SVAAGVAYNDILMLQASELAQMVKNGTLPPNLQERHTTCAMAILGGRMPATIFTAQDADQIQAELKRHEMRVEDIVTVRGQVAFPGVVRGRVVIVRSAAHNNNVQVGDILISPMTYPELLPAMKRAAAFVTDTGGITCHAAIVARELKKPCVIGCRQATRVFRDGDVVEVDAKQGIVRKI
ncbi:MAG: phosphoenolpyruvate synthase, partial [Candidatus Magasanikbacteria bacterium]|nr:phosphoenolpyruvate synthase [Candidatus Magasanikbacteria bacterium]